MAIEGAVEDRPYRPCDGPGQLVFRVETPLLYHQQTNPSTTGADHPHGRHHQLLTAIAQRDMETGRRSPTEMTLPQLELDLFLLKKSCMVRAVNVVNQEIATRHQLPTADISVYHHCQQQQKQPQQQPWL